MWARMTWVRLLVNGLPEAEGACAQYEQCARSINVLFELLRDECRPHPVNRTERKEADSWWLTGVKLGSPWPKLGQRRANLGLINLRRTQASWLQLGPNFSPTGPTWRNLGMFERKLGLTCATWTCVGASGAEVGPKTGPTWGKRPRTNIEAKRFGGSFCVVVAVMFFG